MARTVNPKRIIYINEVKALKQSLLDAGIKNAKILFFDEKYGKILKTESMKLDNLWACKSADKSFTTKLRNFTNSHI